VWYAPVSIAYSKSAVNAYPFDLAKAKSLLNGAGVKDLTLTFAVDTSDPNFEAVAQIWQANLRQIGVNMVIKPVADALWNELGSGVDVKGIDLIGWNVGRVYQDPAILLGANPQFHGGTENPMGYRNARLEQLITQGPGEVNPAKRKAMYQEISQILISDCPILPITSVTDVWAWSKNVSGYGADLLAQLELANANI
jgi:peptide/nickel transport system substrate-binding protein